MQTNKSDTDDNTCDVKLQKQTLELIYSVT